jgi:hypothetical protein
MSAKGLLREDENTIAHDLEDAATALEQLHGGVGVFRRDLGRQTGGPGFIVSDDAVANGDVHAWLNNG